ncbi:MAG: flagellar protein export ATPase FliI [Alphaproteobacteria bacterium]
MSVYLSHLVDEISAINDKVLYGTVSGIQGMLVEINGMQGFLSIGDRLDLLGRRQSVTCEVIGFRGGHALAMPYNDLSGIGLGNRVRFSASNPVIHPHESWLGRVVNGFGKPIDGKGNLQQGDMGVLIRNKPPPAHSRQRVGEKIDLGVRVLNSFTTCCRGQRLGIFAGSGVGKSVLMGMLAKHSEAEIIVIGLIGERGREVQEFIQGDLGEEGLKRSVVVIATGDESSLMRRDAAFVTLSIAEYFRDLGKDVLVLMDSVTRFAMALREIGLSVGEPPATKGYTPSVFSQLPRLLERAGPCAGQGTITGLFTVLVDGDDHNEPIADAVRGILDGHIVLDRSIADRNRFPAVNVLRSVSRTMPACNDPEDQKLIVRAKQLMAAYDDMAELIRLGAYRTGSDQNVDDAIKYHDDLESFIAQSKDEKANMGQDFTRLSKLFSEKAESPAPGPDQQAPNPQNPNPQNLNQPNQVRKPPTKLNSIKKPQN